MTRLWPLFFACLLACGDASSAPDGGTAGASCPPCADGEICVATCDGDGENGAGHCQAVPAGCDPAELGCSEACSTLCESVYECEVGIYCEEVRGADFYCHGP